MGKQKNKGFTLAELLIVVAIIAVLVSISIPIFHGQVEKANKAVDLAAMRSAKALVIAEYLDTGKEGKYYFNGSSVSQTDIPSSGYGKSSSDASTFWIEGGEASGVPKDHYLTVTIDKDGKLTYNWGGSFQTRSYSITSEIKSGLAADDPSRLKSDVDLLNTLQTNINDLTMGQLKAMGVSSFTNGSVIATCLLNNGKENKGTGYNKVSNGWEDFFEQSGVNVSGLGTGNEYLITSISTNESVHIRLKLPKNFDKYSDDEKITGAVMYVDSHKSNLAQEYGLDYSSRK